MTTGNEVRCLALSDEGKENLHIVHDLTQKKGMRCVWTTSDETENVSAFQEEVAYVIDPLQGPEETENIVQKFVDLGYPVLGSQCMLTLLKHGLQLHGDMNYPVDTLTMLGTVVCFSNILHDERIKLTKYVQMMGGRVAKPLDLSVTHLVVGHVGSVKYLTATTYNIKIMTKDWIYHLWKVGTSKYVCAKDVKWEEFMCPLFHGCKICLTGFSAADKVQIQKLVSKFGGEYSGAMKLNFTTHLIVNKAEGQKFKMAQKFGVKVVNIDWLHDSIDKGFCLDNLKYPVKIPADAPQKPTHHQSTPDKPLDGKNMSSVVDISNIDPSTINETVASTMNDTSLMSRSRKFGPGNRLVSMPTNNQSYVDVLDGVHVYLVGFSFQEEEKMSKLLSLAGAVKRAQLSSNVSKVVVGDPSRISGMVKHEILTMSSENPDLNVVGQDWVLDSLSNGKIMPEKDYWQTSILPSDYEETRSHAVSEDDTTFNGMPTVKRNTTKQNVPLHDGSMLAYLLPDDDNTVLSQYINPVNGGEPDQSFPNQSRSTLTRDDTNDGEMEHDDQTTTMDTTASASNVTTEGIFDGKTFFVVGFSKVDTKDLISEIESHGGLLLPVDSKKISDYAVVPLTGWLIDKTAAEVVTIFWVQYCTQRKELVPLSSHPMFLPFSVPTDAKPLGGVVACLSKYRDAERNSLTRLISELGGTSQELVARKDMSNLKKTTHLIIHEPGGEKFVGCQKWGIPIVSENWVYESARNGVRQNERDFDVNDQINETTLADQTGRPPENNIHELSGNNARHKLTGFSGWNSEFPPIPRPPSVVNKIREKLEIKKNMTKKALDEAMKNAETPVTTRYKRIQNDLETPSKFMTKGNIEGNMSFDLTEVFELLKTPAEQRAKVREEASRHPDTPLSEIMTRCLDAAVKKIPDRLIQNLAGKLARDFVEDSTSPSSDKESCDTGVSKQHMVSKIFDGLVISLAAKLHKEFSNLSKVVTTHGGEFRWTYDKACTHFLFRGRLKDKNKEFCTAKKDKKIIVSPCWIESCVIAEARLEESMFPHVYDPNKSIQMESPSQRTRSSSQTKSLLSSPYTNHTEASDNDDAPPRRKRAKKDTDPTLDSQETRDLLQKKLANIMAESSITRDLQPHRLSVNKSSISSPAQRRASTLSSNLMQDKDSELSQDVQVSWDDPTGREEMLRLMGKEVSCQMEMTVEDKDLTTLNPTIDPLNTFFMMSSMTHDKTKYSTIISEIGANLIESAAFDRRCTHLLVPKPGRSEKYLSALASGKCIIHPKYLDECKMTGNLLSEDAYEYGNPENPDTRQFMEDPETLQSMIALSAYRWRKKLAGDDGVPKTEQGSFSGWSVLLDVNERQQKGFERVLKCGLGKVVEDHVITSEIGSQVTHIFVDQDCAKSLSGDIVKDLVLNHKVHMCDPTYIGDFLLKNPLPSPASYYIPQAAAFVNGSGVSRS